MPGSWPACGTSWTSSSTSSTMASGSSCPCARASRSRCSTTLRSGKKSRSSITVATLRRISGEVSDIGVPSTSMVPSSGRSAPTRQRSRVDLPAPLRPVRAMASPARTSRLNPSKMVWEPKARFSPDTLSTVVRLAMRRDSAPSGQWIPPTTTVTAVTGRRRTAPSRGAAVDYASADWQVNPASATSPASQMAILVGSPSRIASRVAGRCPNRARSPHRKKVRLSAIRRDPQAPNPSVRRPHRGRSITGGHVMITMKTRKNADPPRRPDRRDPAAAQRSRLWHGQQHGRPRRRHLVRPDEQPVDVGTGQPVGLGVHGLDDRAVRRRPARPCRRPARDPSTACRRTRSPPPPATTRRCPPWSPP